MGNDNLTRMRFVRPANVHISSTFKNRSWRSTLHRRDAVHECSYGLNLLTVQFNWQVPASNRGSSSNTKTLPPAM
uniref:Uncharacterized protein n=1 Tax=Timema genevievae TaxID=629358 RepID=A0A7R9PKR9_TIMGE|nr:unnamed protein product [Timema genevievae]